MSSQLNTHSSVINLAKNASNLVSFFGQKVDQEEALNFFNQGMIDSLTGNIQPDTSQALKFNPKLIQSKILSSEMTSNIQNELMEAMRNDEELFKNNLDNATDTPVNCDGFKEAYMIETCDSDLLVATEVGLVELVCEKSVGFRMSKKVFDKKVISMKEIEGNIYIQTASDFSLLVYSKIGQRMMKTFPGYKIQMAKIAPNFKISQSEDIVDSVLWYQGGLNVAYFDVSTQKTTVTDDFIPEGSLVLQMIAISKPKKVILLSEKHGHQSLIV